MKQGVYTVRGTIGSGKSEPVEAAIAFTQDGGGVCSFVFRDVSYAYRPRPMSPNPERILPSRVPVCLQPTARSIAAAAFKAATEAAAEDVRAADNERRAQEQEGMSIEDIALGGIERRSMGMMP